MGARPSILKNLEAEFQVEPEYISKWKRSKKIAYLLNLLGMMDRKLYQLRKNNVTLPEEPVFILGHWRSGTTLTHNLLCKITDATYCTTYQNAFPNNLFVFYGLIRLGMQKYMPDERPADGLKIHTRLPQEEEFAIGNVLYHCFYYWMYFPKETRKIADAYLLTEEKEQRRKWRDNYLRFIRRTQLRNGGNLFISKNPPNTARIKDLLELFPKAKFLFLHRNPYETVRSTQKFYKGVLPVQQFQSISDQELEDQVFQIHKSLHKRYWETRDLIPDGNLIELSFHDLVKDPLHQLTSVLDRWKINYAVPETVKAKYNNDSHQIREYSFSNEYLSRVNSELSEFINYYGYDKKS